MDTTLLAMVIAVVVLTVVAAALLVYVTWCSVTYGLEVLVTAWRRKRTRTG